MAIPFATNEIKVELSFDDGTTWLETVETTTVNNKQEGEIADYSIIGSKFKKRFKTGGLTNDYTFESKLVVGTPIYDEIRKVYLGESMGNSIQLRTTFPHSSDETKTGEIFETTGVLVITEFGGQGADDLAVVNMEFKSSGQPTATAEEIVAP